MNTYKISVGALLIALLVPLTLHGASTTERKTEAQPIPAPRSPRFMLQFPKSINILGAKYVKNSKGKVIFFGKHREAIQKKDKFFFIANMLKNGNRDTFEVVFLRYAPSKYISLPKIKRFKRIATRYYTKDWSSCTPKWRLNNT